MLILISMSSTDGDIPPELGLRERKKRATRLALQHAALELVTSRGLDCVTVEDITDAVGVSPRTFFNYFATKEDALVDADPYLVEVLVARLQARPLNEPPLISLKHVFLKDAQRISQAKDIWRMRFALGAKHPEIFHAATSATAKLDSALAQAIAERIDVDITHHPLPRLATGVASAARRAALHLWGRGDFSTPYPQLLSTCFDELERLLTNP